MFSKGDYVRIATESIQPNWRGTLVCQWSENPKEGSLFSRVVGEISNDKRADGQETYW